MKLISFIHQFMPSRTTPTEYYRVPSLPQTVRIYRIEASRFWQFRFFGEGKYVRKSTRELDRAKALEKAKQLYRDVLLSESLDSPIHRTKFSAASKNFIRWQQDRVKLRRLGERTHNEDVYILNRHVLPFFGAYDVSEITKRAMESYLASLADRSLSKSTQSKHVNVIRKVLNLALEDNIIKALPRFPKVGVDDNARAYFDLNDYKKLSQTARAYVKQGRVADYVVKGRVVRKLKYTLDFASLIDFGVNVFVRISDIKDLRHEHITVVAKGSKSGASYLKLVVPHSKTAKSKGRTSVTLEKAVAIYEELREHHKSNGFDKAHDYVFFPELNNRDYAMDVMGRLMRNILDDTGLRKDKGGKVRTLYSLRHSALMFRFQYGDKIDIYLLAKNALTSVAMLEKHYLSHVESQTRVDELQSWKHGEAVYQLPDARGRGAARRKAR